MRIVIDWDLCQGHGNCMGDAPAVFQVTNEGVLTVLQETPPSELREQVELAVSYCPTGAISLVSEG